MEFREFEELATPDDRSLRFTPLGFSMAGPMPASAAAEHHQRSVARFELTEDVPEQTQRAFDRLREIHTYGLLCYDLFTVAHDQAFLFRELALGERFIEMYSGRVPLVYREGESYTKEATLEVARFEEVYKAFAKGGAFADPHWRLKLNTRNEPMWFRATLDHLVIWARREGLLTGQRSRQTEALDVDMRHHIAHYRSFHIGSPVDSARSVLDAAEFVNQLWGHQTPGGRLYPAPIERTVTAIGWNPEGTAKTMPRADQLAAISDETLAWTWIIVRGVIQDELMSFSSEFEFTAFPCDYLWGPGTFSEALEWLGQNSPQADQVAYQDRLFVVRQAGESVDWARRPEVAAGLAGDDRSGTWFLLRADYPGDAVAHVRTMVHDSGSSCSTSGYCNNCAVEHLAKGSWQKVMDAARALGVTIRPVAPIDVRVPGLF